MKLTAVILATLISTGCIFVGGNHNEPVNYAPTVQWAEAGCFWDSYYYEDVWYFDADVSDQNGALDIVGVYADVYDYYTGHWIESFPLDPTNDPTFWSSTWFADTTFISCYYPGYEIDITVYDSSDAYDVMTIIPYTYH